MLFQGCFKEVSKKFHGSFKSDSIKCSGYLKKVSRKIVGCFNGVFSRFQGYLKEVVIAGKFQICLKEVLWMFQERI